MSKKVRQKLMIFLHNFETLPMNACIISCTSGIVVSPFSTLGQKFPTLNLLVFLFPLDYVLLSTQRCQSCTKFTRPSPCFTVLGKGSTSSRGGRAWEHSAYHEISVLNRTSIVVGSRAQFLRPFSGQDVLMIDFTSWSHLLKI